MTRISGIIIGALIAVALGVSAHGQTPTVNVSILHTGDTHGHLRAFNYDSNKPVGGVAKRAIFFQDKRRHKKMVWLTLDSGDAISGTALSDIFKGYLDIEAMNRLGYDGMVLGVHEFDYGVDVLKQRMAEAKFPILSANIFSAETGQPFAKPYVILEREGVKIAVFGLTTGELEQRVAPENFTGLAVQDPIEVARELVPQLRQQADVVVAVTHLGINSDIQLAGQVRGIDVICGGMSHSELQVPMKVGETLITHDAAYGRTVGMMKLSFGRNIEGGMDMVYFASQLVPLDSKWVENSDYVNWLGSYQPQLQERLGLIVGSTAAQMSDLRLHSSETELGNYVCDILRQRAGADLAILPAAFFQGSLPKGAITLGDLFSCMPYDHYGLTLNVTGGELQQILNDAADQIGKEGFPQVSGLSFGIFDGKAYMVRVNGVDIDPFASYKLATSDYLASGVFGYATLGTIASRSYTGRLIRDMVQEQLAGGQIASSTLYQRITFLAQAPSAAPVEETLETPPAEEVVPPADEEAVAEVPAADTAIPAEEPAVEPPAEPASDEGLDGLRYDRNGQPLTIEDEVVHDAASDAEAAPIVPEEAPPAEDASIPPSEPDLTPPLADATGTVVGSAVTSAGGLAYEFALYDSDRGYEFELNVTNTGDAPVELAYATNERFDFIVVSGTDILWHLNINRFFVQSPLTETLGAGEKIAYRGAWNGNGKDNQPLAAGRYRFEAVHQLAAGPVRMGFEAELVR